MLHNFAASEMLEAFISLYRLNLFYSQYDIHKVLPDSSRLCGQQFHKMGTKCGNIL